MTTAAGAAPYHAEAFLPLASVARVVCRVQRPRGGVERPRRKERFARLTHAARPRSWRTCGPRRRRRQSELALVATQGDAAGAAPSSGIGAAGGPIDLGLGLRGGRWAPLTPDNPPITGGRWDAWTPH
jgi:hypothetical protein